MLRLQEHPEKVKQIREYLRELEVKYKIEIIKAVVVGSRQFGIESPESDWDIRFIYRDELDWYFQSNDKVDSITEKHLDLDVHGINVAKAVKFIIKSNGAFYEWMSSPHSIFSAPSAWGSLYTELLKFYNPHRLHHFFYTIAKDAKKEIDCRGYDLKKMLIWARGLLSIHHLKEYGELEQDMSKLIEADTQLTPMAKQMLGEWIQKRNASTEPSITHASYLAVYGELEYRTAQEFGTPMLYEIPPHREPTELDIVHRNIILKQVAIP